MFTVRRIILCADDFGASAPISHAIIDLAHRGAISATSCLVDGPRVRIHARTLLNEAAQISVGLHFDLTEFAPESIRADLGSWLWRAFLLRNTDLVRVRAEFLRQVLRFESLFDRAPDFIDGHRHVHQLPGIREVVLDETQRRYRKSVAIRSTCALSRQGPKARFIQELGGRGLKTSISHRALTCNSDFAGAYDFSRTPAYATRMAVWLKSIVDGGLIMCHPKIPRPELLNSARVDEYRFFSSDEWPRLRGEHRIELQPFRAN